MVTSAVVELLLLTAGIMIERTRDTFGTAGLRLGESRATGSMICSYS